MQLVACSILQAFKHKLFARVWKASLVLNKLTISNGAAQKRKILYQEDEQQRASSIIEFPHLTWLKESVAVSSHILNFHLSTKQVFYIMENNKFSVRSNVLLLVYLVSIFMSFMFVVICLFEKKSNVTVFLNCFYIDLKNNSGFKLYLVTVHFDINRSLNVAKRNCDVNYVEI